MRSDSMRGLRRTGLMYNIILWDADDTLLDFEAAQGQSFERTMKEAGLPSGEEYHRRYSMYNNALWQEFNEGKVTKEFLLTERFARYLRDIGADQDPGKLNDEYLNNLSLCSELMPQAYETVRMLDEMGARQYIITNAVSFVNRRRVGNSRIAPFIKGIFVSEEIGFSKPDRRYYESVFERIDGFRANRTLAVGDSLSSDIRGGQNAGIDTCYYNPKRLQNTTSIRPDYEFEELGEVVRLAAGERLCL